MLKRRWRISVELLLNPAPQNMHARVGKISSMCSKSPVDRASISSITYRRSQELVNVTQQWQAWPQLQTQFCSLLIAQQSLFNSSPIRQKNYVIVSNICWNLVFFFFKRSKNQPTENKPCTILRFLVKKLLLTLKLAMKLVSRQSMNINKHPGKGAQDVLRVSKPCWDPKVINKRTTQWKLRQRKRRTRCLEGL